MSAPQPPLERTVIVVPATNEGSRTVIARLAALIEGRGSKDQRNGLEIAMAEVLNNVVEHAYQRIQGNMEIVVEPWERGISITIWDDGDPMPAGRLPLGYAAKVKSPPHEQAEGGYGLFILRQLAKKLRYQRVGERNKLSFLVALEADDTT